MIGQATIPFFLRPLRRLKCPALCCDPDPLAKVLCRLTAVTFLLLLPLACHDLTHSSYFARLHSDHRKEAMKTENDARIVQARRYLEMLDQTKLEHMLRQFEGEDHSHSQDIIISIITVSRNRHAMMLDGYQPYYLTQVVWKFLQLLHTAQASGFPYHVRMIMCNVDPDPENYEEVIELSKYIPAVNLYNKLTLNMGHPLEKEKQDYVFCLNSSLVSNPGYVFLVEDDALPHADLFPVLWRTLDTRLERRYTRGDLRPPPPSGAVDQGPGPHDVAYVKFYHPERLLGFLHPEWERLPEWLGWGFTLGSPLAWLFLRLYGRAHPRLGGVHAVWAFFVLYVMAVTGLVGRVYVNEARRAFSPLLYTFSPAPSCCTPAMLFPATGGARVASYLTNVQCGKDYGKDTAIEDFLRGNADLNAYQVQPNTFTHIGMYSSLRAQIVDPYLV